MESTILGLLPLIILVAIFGAIFWGVSRDRKAPGPGGLTPYGTRGFLGLFIIVSRYIGPLLGAGMIMGEFAQIERQNPGFYASDEMGRYMGVTWTFFAVIVGLSWWYTTKLKNEFTRSSVDFAVRSLIAVGVATPLMSVAMLSLILKVSNTDVLVTGFMKTAIQGLMSCGVWVAYLRMSKRVKNTYIVGPQILARENAAAVSGSGAPRPTAAQLNAAPATPVVDAPAISSQAPVLTPAQPVVATTTPAAPAPPSVAPPPVVATTATTTETTPATTKAQAAPDLDPDHFFALALTEFEGPQRNRGRWARLYAASGGNESAAQAAYLKETAQELQEAHQRELQAAARLREEEERLAREKAKLLMEKHVGHNGEYLLKQFLDGSATVTGADGKARIFGNVDQAMTWVRGQA